MGIFPTVLARGTRGPPNALHRACRDAGQELADGAALPAQTVVQPGSVPGDCTAVMLRRSWRASALKHRCA